MCAGGVFSARLPCGPGLGLGGLIADFRCLGGLLTLIGGFCGAVRFGGLACRVWQRVTVVLFGAGLESFVQECGGVVDLVWPGRSGLSHVGIEDIDDLAGCAVFRINACCGEGVAYGPDVVTAGLVEAVTGVDQFGGEPL